MKFSESSETYLKEIFRISQTAECVRCTDVADRLNVSAASVNRAVKLLSREKYLEHKAYGLIFLTDAGRKKAQELCLNQEIITKYLMKTLSLNRTTAFNEACKIEHVVSPSLIKKMKELLAES